MILLEKDDLSSVLTKELPVDDYGNGIQLKTDDDWQKAYDSNQVNETKQSLISQYIQYKLPNLKNKGVIETLSQEIAELGFVSNMFVTYVGLLMKNGIDLNSGTSTPLYNNIHNLCSDGVVQEDDILGRSKDKMDSIVFNKDMFNGSQSPDDCNFIVKAYYWITSAYEFRSNVDNEDKLREITGDDRATVSKVAHTDYSSELVTVRNYIIYANHENGAVRKMSDIRDEIESLHTGSDGSSHSGTMTVNVSTHSKNPKRWSDMYNSAKDKPTTKAERDDLISWLLDDSEEDEQ